MAHSEPERAQSRRTRSTADAVRRRLVLILTVPALLLAHWAYSAAGQLLYDPGKAPYGKPPLPGGSRETPIAWPEQGQAALALGSGRAAASPHQEPAPIASLAKVMTAYVTLERHPLRGEQEGFTITVSAAQAQAEARESAQGASVVAVRPGERLTERELLQALLIPSGNNIAQMLATAVAGSESGFLEEMNAQADALGMRRTTYTDPSGFDPGTVSTAADQLRLLRRAMRFAVFRGIVSMPSVTLPVAGTLTNFNPLIAAGFAGKTGSDSAAGGCLAFFTRVTSGGRRLTAAGVVMGQGGGSDTRALLRAAGEAAERLVGSAVGAPVIRERGRGAPGVPG